MNFDTPLHPAAQAQRSKSLQDFTSKAVYAVATLNRALGTIEGAEVHTKHAKRAVWAEMDASTAAQSGAQALLNLATIYDNRAGGPTETGAALAAAAQEVWTLCQSQATAAEPAPIFEDLREVLSTTAGLILAALDTDTRRKH